MDDQCVWAEDEDGQWLTDCDYGWALGSPEDIGFKFCPYCGLPLTEVAYTGDVDDSIYINGGEG